MAPKYKEHKLQKNDIICKFKCPHINSPEQYIGESGRTLGDSVKVHLRAPFTNIATLQGIQSVQTVSL